MMNFSVSQTYVWFVGFVRCHLPPKKGTGALANVLKRHLINASKSSNPLCSAPPPETTGALASELRRHLDVFGIHSELVPLWQWSGSEFGRHCMLMFSELTEVMLSWWHKPEVNSKSI